MAEYTNQSMCLDWDDCIENDGQEFVLLKEGDYNFRVAAFERGRHAGSAKVPPCNKATLTLEVETDNGTATVRTDLLLYGTLEWRISAFFRCIGQKRHGEKVKMDWSKVYGAKGRAHFKPRPYIGADGTEKKANDIAYFIDYDEKFFPEDNSFTEIEDDDLPFD